MSARKKKKNEFLLQGSILAAASIICRMIGLIYRVPMMNILGEEGNGLYSVAYNIYNIALILSSYSLPLSVSKLVAARNVKKEYKNAYQIFRCAMIFGCISGLVAGGIIFIFADSLASLFGFPKASYALKILAPTILVVAIVGVLRGFFQGKNTMLPTAFSQLVEQIVNAFISVIASYYFMKMHSASKDIAGYGAAGGTVGTLLGACSALLFLMFIFLIYKPVIRKQIKRDTVSEKQSTKEVYQLMLLTVAPIILSQTVYQLSTMIDTAMFGQIMSVKKMSFEIKEALIGRYSKYTLLISVPLGISSAMSSSILPSIASSKEKKDINRIRNKVHDSIKLNMYIAFPCALGLVALAYPIIEMLFPGSDKISGQILRIGAIAIVFYTLSTISSAVLQGLNKLNVPVRHSAFSLLIHCIIVFILLWFTDIGIYALAVGNVLFPLVVSILNWIAIRRYLHYHQEVIKTFLVPCAASLIMGVATYLIYKGLFILLHRNTVCVLLSIIIAIILYIILILLFKGMTEEEICNMPLGRTLAKIAKKLHLLT